MDKKELIEDSLEFCRDIKVYFGENKLENPEIYKYEKAKKNLELKHKRANGFEGNKEIFPDIYYDSNIKTKDEPTIKLFSKNILIFLICIVLAALSAILITTYIGQHTKVDGKSMENTLNDGDILIIDKLSYRFENPQRYDIIVFKYQTNVNYIKRIIGLPGETVKIEGGKIYINGSEIKENYGKEIIIDAGNAKNNITLGKDEYFVMGDNRNHSLDSRFTEVGVVNKEKFLGKAWFRIFPLNKIGRLKHQ